MKERNTTEIAEDVARTRLERIDEDRQLRFAIYRLHWQQKWDAAEKKGQPAPSRSLWRVK